VLNSSINYIGPSPFGAPCVISGFFGLVGPISELDFRDPEFTDNPTVLNLENIVIAVPEPFTASLFGIGLAGAVAARRRRRTAGLGKDVLRKTVR
jgi:hypothetical protein